MTEKMLLEIALTRLATYLGYKAAKINKDDNFVSNCAVRNALIIIEHALEHKIYQDYGNVFNSQTASLRQDMLYVKIHFNALVQISSDEEKAVAH